MHNTRLRELRREGGEPQMTGKTGQKCTAAGKYHCQTHPASTRMMKVDEVFPQCNPPVGGPAHDTTWVKDETT